MELILYLFDLFLHLDKHLYTIITQYGAWSYLILFTVIFCETGLVITPFLPGDSLLFAAGAIAALGALRIDWLILLLIVAAIAGDTLNYSVGHFIGPRALSSNNRFLKKEYMDRTQRFYEKHGGKTIILARFVPIVRTFAPFLAGVGIMSYSRFIIYNVVGGVIWVVLFTLAGYFFGNLAFVEKNFSLVILAIIFLSLVPAVVEVWRDRREQRNPTKASPASAADNL